MRATPLLSTFLLALPLAACDKIDLPFGDDEGEGEGEGKVIEAPPDPLDLHVQNATINMITVKDGEVEVPAKFGDVSGVLTFADEEAQQGLEGALTIGLDSWDSGLGVRDERVQTLFFQVEQNKSATFTLERVDGLPEGGVAVGHEVEATAIGKVYIGGGSADVEAPIKLSRSGDKDYHIDTTAPFVVSIESIGLMEPLKELMRVCGHKSIDDSVKVSARIDLGPNPPEKAEEVEEPEEDKPARQAPSVRDRMKSKRAKAKRKGGR